MDYSIVFYNDDILIKNDSSSFLIPEKDLLLSNKKAVLSDGFHFMSNDVDSYTLYDLSSPIILPEGWHFSSFRECREHYLEPHYKIATQCLHLLHWSRSHQFCGVCGTKLPSMNPDRSKKCSACGHMLFPYMGLAVITAIYKDDKILLAHNANFPENLYSLIAGFVDSGETLEAAVEREILEEVGLKVKNIKYFGSQPWPFPNSLMIGFTAEYESGDIQPDDIEIEHAEWFTKENLPNIPHHYSIARQIINQYLDN